MIRRAVLGLLVLLGACSNERLGPRTEVYVLIDLSETWNNPENIRRNTELFRELGNGIVLVSDEQEPPFSVQVRPIGLRSLEREPICQVIYRARMAPVASQDRDEVTERPRFLNYMASDCPAKLLNAPQEAMTEITASLQSIANLQAAGADHRYLIILSDFREETHAPLAIEGRPLASFDVIMIYRPLADDQLHPANLRARVEAWRRLIAGYGAARVVAIPDTGLRRETVADVMMGN